MAEKDREDNDFDAVPSPPQGDGGAPEPAQAEETGINLQNLLNTDICVGMTGAARRVFDRCVTRYGLALARESSRLEEANRAEDVIKAEITATMVVNANDVLRPPRNYEQKASIFVTFALVTSFALAIATPIVFATGLTGPWRWTATSACGILAVAGQLYAIVKVRRK